ncbi:MAG: DNA primase [bacterium]|nr:DNA primase [bacterium]
MSVVDEIKSRLDIVTYIQQYAPLRKAGRTYKACCPFHSEKTPSFSVNPDTQTWRCFGACAEGGDIFSFAMKQNGWSFGEALENLGRMAGVEVKKQSPEQRQREDVLDKLRGLMQSAAEIYHRHLIEGKTEASSATLSYARTKRGLTDETITRFQIGFAPAGWSNMLEALLDLGYKDSEILDAGIATRNDNGRVYDRFRNRLMIPIYDERGRVIGFGARALDPDDNPKYLNSPQTPLFDKSRVLFGLHLAKKAISDSETAVIVEGYMDAIQAHQAGFTNVVAQMGTAMTETQIKMLAPRYAKKIILALDSDAAGQSATRRSLETARQTLESDYAGRLSVDLRILQIPGAKDPDDLIRETPDSWRDLMQNAVPVADYVIQMEAAALPQNATVQEREAVARRVLPVLTASENNLYTQDNIQKLSRRLRIAEDDLLEWARQEKGIIELKKARQAAIALKDNLTGEQNKDEVAKHREPSSVGHSTANSVTPRSESLNTVLNTSDVNDISPTRPNPSPINTRIVKSPSIAEAILEAHCLSLLFRNSELYYQVNRKFRELAGDNELLRQGPLCDLGVVDFNRVNFRVLMQTFLEALQQHDLEILDYVREYVHPSLLVEIDLLLEDESRMVHEAVGERFWGDFIHDLWQDYKKYTFPRVKPNLEIIEKSLRLRLMRLKREINEYNFMQQDAQETNQWTFAVELGIQIAYAHQARLLLDAELDRQINPIRGRAGIHGKET